VECPLAIRLAQAEYQKIYQLKKTQAPAPGGRSMALPLQPATPFLKWAGGKSQLLKTFERYFPPQFKSYFEPFLGGGAVFFHLAAAKRDLKAILSDSNAELINAYQMIGDELDTVIELLKKHRNDKHYYYKIRAQDASRMLPAERAARLIYLNKTCFNGLYRVNSKGHFNVPFGRYKNPRILDERNLRAVKSALEQVEIDCAPFEHVLMRARQEDLIYFDPPYHPLSATANFTGYTRGAFTFNDQKRLADVFRMLSKRGCYLMLSNSDTPDIRQLYKGFRIETVLATRAINCVPEKRGRITELLVLNY
jgi:DNA adenine methylase